MYNLYNLMCEIQVEDGGLERVIADKTNIITTQGEAGGPAD